jgi:hypothetical protein
MLAVLLRSSVRSLADAAAPGNKDVVVRLFQQRLEALKVHIGEERLRKRFLTMSGI